MRDMDTPPVVGRLSGPEVASRSGVSLEVTEGLRPYEVPTDIARESDRPNAPGSLHQAELSAIQRLASAVVPPAATVALETSVPKLEEIIVMEVPLVTG